MKRYRMKDLNDNVREHVLEGLVPGKYINKGGLGFKAPGERTHSHDGPEGSDSHIHGDCEIFILLQGKASMEINGEGHAMCAGDIIVIEPGEDHHLVADEVDPCVNIWMHCGEQRNPLQVKD